MNKWDLETHEQLARTTPLEEFDVSNPAFFQYAVWMPYFRRLRQEEPIHFCSGGPYGSYWSITKYKDIMSVDTDYQTYSSDIDYGGIHLADRPAEVRNRSFITSDPPRHNEVRRVIQPLFSPASLAAMEPNIRRRTREVLERLPKGEVFDWVTLVSRELTMRTLAEDLFDIPSEDRQQVAYWADVAFVDLSAGTPIDTEEKRLAVLLECLEYFEGLRAERRNHLVKNDLISLLAHGEATKEMSPSEFLGNLITLIVGGNETTRNSMSAGIIFLNEHPEEYNKLIADRARIESMVPEIIRFQTPILTFRRTATRDATLGGKRIREGDRVAMWYVSGNRDEEVIEAPNQFIIDRFRPRQHLAFGFGIHRCIGNRLAEMQLSILWEEILPRFRRIEIAGAPVRSYSNFINGISELPVRIVE